MANLVLARHFLPILKTAMAWLMFALRVIFPWKNSAKLPPKLSSVSVPSLVFSSSMALVREIQYPLNGIPVAIRSARFWWSSIPGDSVSAAVLRFLLRSARAPPICRASMSQVKKSRPGRRWARIFKFRSHPQTVN